jgi:hypothetical protein
MSFVRAATAALFVALIVGGWTWDNNARSGSPKVAGFMSAVVNLDGSLARGYGAVSSVALGVDGQYDVTFNRDVSTCAYVANGGEATATSPDDAVVFTVAPREGNTRAVFVQEWDGVLGYDSYSSGFHLIVVC